MGTARCAPTSEPSPPARPDGLDDALVQPVVGRLADVYRHVARGRCCGYFVPTAARTPDNASRNCSRCNATRGRTVGEERLLRQTLQGPRVARTGASRVLRNGVQMSITEATRTCFSKFVIWSGRARRSEFWWFYLVVILVLIVAAIIDAAAGTYPLFYALAGLVVFLPTLSAQVRRLHDTERSGWWLFIALIPLVGSILLIVWLAQEGKPGLNKYGPNPKETELPGGSQPAAAW